MDHSKAFISLCDAFSVAIRGVDMVMIQCHESGEATDNQEIPGFPSIILGTLAHPRNP